MLPGMESLPGNALFPSLSLAKGGMQLAILFIIKIWVKMRSMIQLIDMWFCSLGITCCDYQLFSEHATSFRNAGGRKRAV